MTSIRLKVTAGAAALLVGGVGALLTANVLFLEPFYAARTRGAFEEIRAAMSRAPDDPQSRMRAASDLASGTGYKVVVVDRDGMVRLSSAPEFQEGQSFPLPRKELEFLVARRDRLQRGESDFGILEAAPPGQSVIQLLADLGRGEILVVTQPLDSFRRSIAVASSFLLIVGGLVLVLEFVVVLLLSRRVVRPILDLAEVARRVAAEDFGARYLRRHNDELGILGDSVNTMADALARNIEDLKAANRTLGLRVKAQERFIASASHELKTPVGLVRGYAEALSLGMYASDAERNELAEVILAEADHLDGLVRDLAGIAAFGEGGLPLTLEESDFLETVSRAVSRFSREARERSLSVDLAGTGPVAARFDAGRIVQVVDNLLSNAIRHARDGSVVAVRVEATAHTVGLEVENAGDRVGDEHLPNLFEPFYRADPSRSRRSGGTGLGLAFVRGVAAAHGGSCGARNTDAGFMVWVSLPRRGPGAG